MKFNKNIIIYIVVFLIIGAVSFYIVKTTDKTLNDAQKFKLEYESLNGKVNESNQKTYRSLSIPEDNPMVYSTAEEIVEKINNKESFIVYFGFSTCPWCRSVIEKLIEVTKENGVEKVYYVDVKDIRDTKELDQDNKAVTTKEGTDAYNELLEKFDSLLDDYTLTDEDGNEIKTGEKRIYAPSVVAIANGVPKKLQTGISELQTDAYMDLTDAMLEDTTEMFECIVKCSSIEETTCSLNQRCE